MAINHPDYGLQCYLLPNSHTGSPGLNYTTLHLTCVLLAKPLLFATLHIYLGIDGTKLLYLVDKELDNNHGYYPTEWTH